MRPTCAYAASRRVIAAVGLLVAVALGLPVPADAGFPGANGELAVTLPGAIGIMNADGTGVHAIWSPGSGQPSAPSWSPDGRRLAFQYREQIWTMRADGSDAKLVVASGDNRFPTWSPDGGGLVFVRADAGRGIPYFADADGHNPQPLLPTPPCSASVDKCNPRPVWSSTGRLALVSDRGGDTLIWSMNPDGSDARKITSFSEHYPVYDWSPDGKRILYAWQRFGSSQTPWLTVIDANGEISSIHTLTGVFHVANAGTEDAAWSPDGTSLVTSLYGGPGACCQYELFTLAPDGFNVARLTNGSGVIRDPDWQPIVAQAPPGTQQRDPRVKVRGGKVRMSRRGDVAVRVRCDVPGVGGVCAGTLRLAPSRRVRCGGRSRRPGTALASRPFRIAGGRTAPVRVRLTTETRKLVACLRRLRVVTTATVARAASGSVAYRSTFTLVAPHR